MFRIINHIIKDIILITIIYGNLDIFVLYDTIINEKVPGQPPLGWLSQKIKFFGEPAFRPPGEKT